MSEAADIEARLNMLAESHLITAADVDTHLQGYKELTQGVISAMRKLALYAEALEEKLNLMSEDLRDAEAKIDALEQDS